MKQIKTIPELQSLANLIRRDVIKMITKAGSGHPAGSLGMVDILTALYFSGLVKHNPKKPAWADRDRIILSNGHICPAQYAALAHAGYFPVKELLTLRKFGSRLQGHPHRGSLPGIETTSGPLGCGLSEAAGLALAFLMDKKSQKVFCLTSDGEHDEGNTWEGVMFAGKYKLKNLIQIIDRNYIQIDGNTEKVMPLDHLAVRYTSFGWEVIEIDGNDMEEILSAIKSAQQSEDKSMVIISHNIPGKGVSFMEGKSEWHGRAPTEKEAEKALKELYSKFNYVKSRTTS